MAAGQPSWPWVPRAEDKNEEQEDGDDGQEAARDHEQPVEDRYWQPPAGGEYGHPRQHEEEGFRVSAIPSRIGSGSTIGSGEINVGSLRPRPTRRREAAKQFLLPQECVMLTVRTLQRCDVRHQGMVPCLRRVSLRRV